MFFYSIFSLSLCCYWLSHSFFSMFAKKKVAGKSKRKNNFHNNLWRYFFKSLLNRCYQLWQIHGIRENKKNFSFIATLLRLTVNLTKMCTFYDKSFCVGKSKNAGKMKKEVGWRPQKVIKLECYRYNKPNDFSHTT